MDDLTPRVSVDGTLSFDVTELRGLVHSLQDEIAALREQRDAAREDAVNWERCTHQLEVRCETEGVLVEDLRARLTEVEADNAILAASESTKIARELLAERARADAAETALREMSEERDRAWEAGRDAAAFKAKESGGRLGSVMLAEAIMRLMPPVKTTAPEPANNFGAHLTEPLGTIDGRVIGAGHVVLSEERYAWLMRRAGISEAAERPSVCKNSLQTESVEEAQPCPTSR